jgi:hypothetical protein
VALLAAAALALGACGGDDEGNGTTDAGSPEFTTNSGTRTTGGTTERERTGTGEDRTTKTKERGDDRGGSGGSGGGGSKNRGSGGNDDSGSTTQPATQPGNVYKVAQTVCNSFLPKQIERALDKGDRKPEDVARDYSRGFIARQRKRAYEGCLAGLKAR